MKLILRSVLVVTVILTGSDFLFAQTIARKKLQDRPTITIKPGYAVTPGQGTTTTIKITLQLTDKDGKPVKKKEVTLQAILAKDKKGNVIVNSTNGKFGSLDPKVLADTLKDTNKEGNITVDFIAANDGIVTLKFRHPLTVEPEIEDTEETIRVSGGNVTIVKDKEWDGTPLTWDDFLGPPDPKSDSAAAETFCQLSATESEPEVSEPKPVGKKFQATARYKRFKVVANFSRRSSWVKPDSNTDLDLLAHEQGHFNICEIFARRITTAVLALNVTSDLKDFRNAAHNDALGKLRAANSTTQKPIMGELVLIEGTPGSDGCYDAESGHGTSEKQKAWTTVINTELSDPTKPIRCGQ